MDTIIISNNQDFNESCAADQLTLLQLSSMATDPYDMVKAQASDDATECTCTSSLSSLASSSQLSGWGSAVSRKSYACLQTLEAESQKRRPQLPTVTRRHTLPVQERPNRVYTQKLPIVGETWGHFVDTPDY